MHIEQAAVTKLHYRQAVELHHVAVGYCSDRGKGAKLAKTGAVDKPLDVEVFLGSKGGVEGGEAGAVGEIECQALYGRLEGGGHLVELGDVAGDKPDLLQGSAGSAI